MARQIASRTKGRKIVTIPNRSRNLMMRFKTLDPAIPAKVLGRLFEEIDEPMTEFDRHRFVKRNSRLFGQDDIGESYLSEPDDKVCCCFEIFEIWKDG